MMESPKLPPLPRPIPWTYDPTFIPVSTEERKSYDVEAQKPKISIEDGTRYDIPAEAQYEVDAGQLRESSAKGGCYVCTLLLRETQRSHEATMQTRPSQSGAPYLVCSRKLGSVGADGNEDRNSYEDDYGATHGVILTDGNEWENFHVTLFVRYPSSSKPSSSFCRSIYTGSDKCLQRSKAWLQHCLESHPKCHGGSSPNAPTRLVEIVSPCEVRLVEPTAATCYFALSYCWGGAQLLCATTKTLAAFKASIPFDQLALTIQDAVGVAYKLGARFLWVDSLCILQDDAQDWEREAKAMCDVYRNATLTIAALGAARATDGRVARRDPLVFQGCRYYRRSNQGIGYSSPSVVNQYTCFSSSALNSRGWTFQERALSRRTLYFGSSIFWECDTGFEKEGETNHGGLEAHFKAVVFPAMEDSLVLQQLHQKDMFESPESKTLKAQRVLKKWDKIVIDFTGRHLTFPSDRLPALAGLIAHYSQCTSWTNVLGLWKEYLLVGLLWRTFHATCRPRRDTSWPTWSWISVQGQVAPATSTGGFLAEAYLDELDNSAVIVHGVPFKLSDFGTWAYYSSAPREHNGNKDLNVEWDTTETEFATQPFGVPLMWVAFSEHLRQYGYEGFLRCLCLVADGSTGSYRRCGYISVETDMKVALEYDIHLRPKQVFRILLVRHVNRTTEMLLKSVQRLSMHQLAYYQGIQRSVAPSLPKRTTTIKIKIKTQGHPRCSPPTRGRKRHGNGSYCDPDPDCYGKTGSLKSLAFPSHNDFTCELAVQLLFSGLECYATFTNCSYCSI